MNQNLIYVVGAVWAGGVIAMTGLALVRLWKIACRVLDAAEERKKQ